MIEQQQQYRANQQKKNISAVDSAFAPFNDNYYKGYTQAYENNLNPQLDFQYGRAGDQLAAGLAGTDQDMGSTGARKTADLYQTYAGARGGIANSAYDATNQLRANVDNSKTGLYGLAQSAIDPLTMSTQAQANAGTIVSPQSYPTLANVFSDVLGSAGAGQQTYGQSMKGQGQQQPTSTGQGSWFAPNP